MSTARKLAPPTPAAAPAARDGDVTRWSWPTVRDALLDDRPPLTKQELADAERELNDE